MNLTCQISRHALASGSSAEPWASARRLIRSFRPAGVIGEEVAFFALVPTRMFYVQPVETLTLKCDNALVGRGR